jgi:hypothetical protein
MSKRKDDKLPDTKPPKGGDFVLHEHIGSQLKAMFDEVVEEPVPDKLRALMDELERKQSKG